MQRFSLGVAALVVFCSTVTAFAQGARATGTVKDTDGRPIKGATVRALNQDASPPEIASTTDDRGRWAMIGLRTGTWKFVAEAPGFSAIQADAPVRLSGTPPMNFTMARDPGPIPGALVRNVMQQVTAANSLRDRGEYEQALTAYQQIRDQNPKLTSIDLVVADLFRRQAAAETDPTARRALLERAIATYSGLASDEATGERARAEMESTRAEIQALTR